MHKPLDQREHKEINLKNESYFDAFVENSPGRHSDYDEQQVKVFFDETKTKKIIVKLTSQGHTYSDEPIREFNKNDMDTTDAH